MSTNIDKHWIGKYKEQLDDLGIKYEEEATKEELKALLDEAKGKGMKSTKEVKTEVDSVVDGRIKALEEKLAKQAELFERLMAEKGAPQMSGLSGEDLVKAVQKAADGRQTEYGLLREEYIPKDDLLESPKVYYMAGPTHNIWGKQVGNLMVPPPFGWKRIKFTEAYGWVTRDGRGLHQKRISTFECWSKTISDFVESLPEFGKMIYLNMDRAMTTSENSDFIALYNKHFGSLMNMSFGKLMEMAHNPPYNMPTSMSYTHKDYAAAIAEKRAMEELEQQRAKFDSAIRSKGVQQMLEATMASATV